jgi:FkbM family methyltransferase
MTNEECVRLLYRYLLGREADPDGLKGWVALADKEGNINSVLQGIVQSAEFVARAATPRPRQLNEATISFCREELGRELVLVDAGAQQVAREEHVYAPLLRLGIDYRIIGFEPLQDRLNERLRSANDPRLTLFPNFVGDGSEGTFYINNIDATSSLFPLNQRFQRVCGLDSLKTIRTQTVKTERLDVLLATLRDIDFLKLDIQGFELAALRGAESILERTNVIHCEVEFTDIYAGQPLFSEVELYLRERGFELIDIVHQARAAYRGTNAWPSAERLVWAEAIFFSRLSDNPSCASRYLAQALSAWYVYGKYGLAEHLFKCYDAVTGGCMARLLQPSPKDVESHSTQVNTIEEE